MFKPHLPPLTVYPPSSSQPLTLRDKSLNDLTLEQTIILTVRQDFDPALVLKIYYASGAECPNKTLTSNSLFFLEYVKLERLLFYIFPDLLGKLLRSLGRSDEFWWSTEIVFTFFSISKMDEYFFFLTKSLVNKFQSCACENIQTHLHTHTRYCVWAGIRCLSERPRTQSALSFNGWENSEPGVSESASLPALPLPLPAPLCSWTQTIKPSTIVTHK